MPGAGPADPLHAEPVVNERVGEWAASPVSSVAAGAVVALDVAGLGERAGVEAFRRAARSANTLAAYRADWDRYTAWSARHGLQALPAGEGTVAAYLAEAANDSSEVGRSAPWRYSPATLARWLATINKAVARDAHIPYTSSVVEVRPWPSARARVRGYGPRMALSDEELLDFDEGRMAKYSRERAGPTVGRAAGYLP